MSSQHFQLAMSVTPCIPRPPGPMRLWRCRILKSLMRWGGSCSGHIRSAPHILYIQIISWMSLEIVICIRICCYIYMHRFLGHQASHKENRAPSFRKHVHMVVGEYVPFSTQVMKQGPSRGEEFISYSASGRQAAIAKIYLFGPRLCASPAIGSD
jgi:hypothetical protein